MHYFYLTLLALSPNAIHGSIHPNLKQNDLSVSDTSRTETENTGSSILRALMNYFQDKKQDDVKDIKSAQNESNVLKDIRERTQIEKNLNIGREIPSTKDTTVTGSKEKNIGRHYFHMDPVFNSLKNRRLWQRESEITSADSSSDMEAVWMEELGEKRLLQKFEAMNSSQPKGDVVNMKVARPWGMQCGDPNQLDLPWGTCMLPPECEAEYRIYRGDYFCGRNEFVCCALERTAYDMYQGLDLSMQRDDSLSTDTEDERNSHIVRSEDRKKRRRAKILYKRSKARLKTKIRNSIKNIITEITKLLQKAYRNGTAYRVSKSRELMEFIKHMKDQYRKDRKTVVDAHEFNLANYEMKLAESLGKVRGMNEAFLTNDTFRDIVVNGTINKENLLRLQRTHPVLSLFFNNRRMGGGDLKPEPEKIILETEEELPVPGKEKLKLVEYDLEYGMLYY